MRSRTLFGILILAATLTGCELLSYFQGPKGDPGKDGAQWYTGSAGPAVDVASALGGDLYLNTASGDIYRYSGDGWIMLMNIRGLAGTAGATWFSGDDLCTCGDSGDHFLDTSSGDIYRKSEDGEWAALLNINGDEGVAGADGNTWLSGSGAPSTDIGVSGDLYLDA